MKAVTFQFDEELIAKLNKFAKKQKPKVAKQKIVATAILNHITNE